MEIKSQVEIEVTSASAKRGSDEIISSLDKVDFASQKATKSASKISAAFDASNKSFKALNEVATLLTGKVSAFTDAEQRAAKSAEFLTASFSSTSATFKQATENLNAVTNKLSVLTDTVKKTSSEYSKSGQNIDKFTESVERSNKSVSNFPTKSIQSIIAYGAAYLSVQAIISGANGILQANRDFETGMVGVAKTTNLAGKDLLEFGDRITAISKKIPVSTTELLEYAQAAGQMGVRGAENLEQFATVMAKVSRSTDLAGADAARGLARILAVSGESANELETLANVVVKLGNNSKATESEITGMTTEIAQALSVFGVASAQSAALAATMKSIGIRAELGGSGVGRAMQTITDAVLGGKKSLDAFSKSLDLNPDRLKKLFETDKIEAFNYFLEGLAKQGEGAGIALKSVGLGGAELTKVLPTLAANLDQLRISQTMANDEVKNGKALNTEFNATLKTFDSQLLVAQGTIKAYAVSLSKVSFEALTQGLTAFNELAASGGFETLATGVTLLSIAFGAKLTSSVVASTVAFARQIPMLTATTIQMNAMGTVISRTTGSMRLMAAAATAGSTALAFLGGPVGVILIAAGSLAYFATRSTDAEKRLKELRAAADATAPALENLSAAAKNLEVSKLTKDIADSTAQLNQFKGLLSNNEKFKMNLNSDSLLVVHRDVELVTNDLAKMKLRLLELEDPVAFKQMKQDAEDLETAFDPIPNKIIESTTGIKDLNKESEKLLINVQKQAELYSNQSRAVEYKYDLEHGLIERSNADIEKNILKAYERIDALDKEKERFEQMMEAEGKMLEEIKKKHEEKAAAISKADDSLIKMQEDRSKQLQADAERAAEATAKPWVDAAERIDGALADAWGGAFDKFTDFRDQMVSGVKKMVGEVIHQLTTKKLSDAFLKLAGPKRTNFGAGSFSSDAGSSAAGYTGTAMQSWASGSGGGGGAGATAAGYGAGAQGAGAGGGGAGGAGALMGMMGAAGPYAIAAVAVVAAVGIWNKKQDEKFVKMTAEYKQANQGMSKVLGEGLKKSETINNSIERLVKTGGEALGVNYNMLQALLDIRAGIGDVAAGFAKTLIGGADYQSLGIAQGKVGLSSKQAVVTGFGDPIDYDSVIKGTGGGQLDTMVAGFMQSIADGVNSAIYNKRKKVIDSGIVVMASNLQAIMEGGVLQAQNYADVKTSKKVLGISAGSKVGRKTEELDELFAKQFASVFANAGKALEISSKTFGIDFNKFIGQLTIKSQDLSLKGLKGEELTKAIESFFGSQIDEWASVILGETSILKDFQKVGESSFDTMLRLASQTEVFKNSAQTLGLNFKATTMEAVYASQAMIEVAGGFDNLSSKLSTYYNKFFNNEEKAAQQKLQIDAQFKELGMTLPATRKGFRELVSSMDLLTEGGRENANSLLDLVPLLDSYYTSIGDLQETAAKNNLLSAQQLYDFSKKTLGVADSLLLSDLSTLTPDQKLSESKKQFDTASAENLTTSAQEYLQQAREFYASSSQYTKIFQEVQDRLRGEAAKALGGTQPSVATPTAAATQSTAIATQANPTAAQQTAANGVNPMDQVVVKLQEANATLKTQLDAQNAIFEETRKQTAQDLAHSKETLSSLGLVVRKLDDLVEINLRGGRIR